MSSSRGKSKNGGGVEIPAGSRKMVQSLKEIAVNCTEAEIYAILKDCNMDPNEAVNRLLTQDPFHEVKSKREKRKKVQNKDTTESRSWVTSSTPSRGSRAGAERYSGRGGSESTKPAPAYRKESGSYTGYLSSTHGIAGSNVDRRPTAVSDAAGNGSKKSAPAAVDGHSAASQSSSGYQPTWGVVPGQVSMADIVKMGRPQSKAPPSIPNASHRTVSVNQNHVKQFPGDHSNVREVHEGPGDYSSSQQLSATDEWPVIEQSSAASQPAVSEPPTSSLQHPDGPDPSNMSFDRIDRQTEMIDETQGEDDRSANEDVDTSDNDHYRYQHQNHTFDSEQAEDINVSVSSAAANLQQLSVKDDPSLPSDGDGPSVVIPNHLQVPTADCSHLSFGSFGGGCFSGSVASAPVQTSLEGAPKDLDSSSVGHLGTRASDYYGDEPLRNESDSNLFHSSNASSGNYDLPSASQPESLKAETSEHDHQYSFPSSAAGYSYNSAHQLGAAFSQPQTSSQMQNLAPFSNVTVYPNSLQSSLLAANVHQGRESELSYPPFPTQAMPTKYVNSVSSISGSTVSMPEALKTAGFPSALPAQQMLSGTGVATGPAVPQHLAVHPYSQPSLPLGPFANMIGYPYMHQNYPYMLQQAFPGNSTYHQSPAAVLPQYKNSISANSSLPQSASSIPSGYGSALGNTTTIPGNFQINPPAAPSGANLSYDDLLSSQYKDTNHLMSLQQSENSGLWHHGPGARTLTTGPANTYYGFQGQNQQTGGGFRQGQQQPSQSYGSLGGYPHFYNSQAAAAAAISLDQQQHQQSLRDGLLAGSQGQQMQQSQQMWQNSNY